jgi:hypothetical protein
MKLVQGTSLAVLLFTLTGCHQSPKNSPAQNDISAEQAVLHAEQAARRVHLPGDLEEAKSRVKKIAQVYREAVELGDDKTRDKADQKLSDIILPQARTANWEGTFRRLEKNAPEGSRTRKQLEEIYQARIKDR